jgi:hypothetical protein
MPSPARPVPVPTERKPDNPQALAAFFLAVVVWGMFGGLLFAQGDVMGEGLVWVPLFASLAFLGGIVLGLQGVGRASAGAGGMAYAVTGLVLMLGPSVLAVLAAVVVAVLALTGVVGPPG